MIGNAIPLHSAPCKQNTCAVVVSYFPNTDFLARLRRIRSQVALLLVVDNASGPSADSLRDVELDAELHAKVIRNPSNLGIASALNVGALWGLENGCQWILTFDQDTVAGDYMLQNLSGVYQAFPQKEKLAVIGSNYLDPAIGTPFLPSTGLENDPWADRTTVITSGSLLSLAAYQTIGPFRDDFFVDCIDFEYCLRARSKGFRVIMSRKPLMHHSVGAITRHRLPWRMTGTSNHAPLRRYYMTRNQLILAREFFWKEPLWILWLLQKLFKSTILMCLFEKGIRLKMKYILMGFVDGLLANLSRKFTPTGRPLPTSPVPSRNQL